MFIFFAKHIRLLKNFWGIKLLLVASMILPDTSFAQKNAEDNSDTSIAASDYFGQKPPGLKPEVFAPGIISLDNHYVGSVTFSPDMSELFFQRRRQGESHNIYTMKLTDGKWSKPELAPFSTNKEYLDFHARFSPDGDRLYFGSTRPLTNITDSTAMQQWRSKKNLERLHQWYIEKNEKGWSKPIPLIEKPFSDRFIMCTTPSSNGNLYFTSKDKEDKLEDEGIYVAIHREDGYTIERLPKEINGYGKWIAHPFIAPDESYILYDAERASGEENGDLYVSFNQNRSWTKSYPLGSEINTELGQGAATVSPDGKFLFYSSVQEGDKSSKIYWVSTAIIENLRPQY